MKDTVTLICVAVLVTGAMAFIANQTHAQGTAKKTRADSPRSGTNSLEAVFQKMDANSDGRLTLAEYMAAMKPKILHSAVMSGTNPAAYELIERGHFKRMDADGNGKLTVAEFKAGRAEPKARPPADTAPASSARRRPRVPSHEKPATAPPAATIDAAEFAAKPTPKTEEKAKSGEHIGAQTTPPKPRAALSERQRYLLRAERLPKDALVKFANATGTDATTAFLKMPGVDELWTADDQFDQPAFTKWLEERKK